MQLTNEFQFPIAAFHHAHETYLVPELLKQAYGEICFTNSTFLKRANGSNAGNVPASAIFATNARYKRESYRGSEFAPKILAQNGLPVVMKVGFPLRFQIQSSDISTYRATVSFIELSALHRVVICIQTPCSTPVICYTRPNKPITTGLRIILRWPQ